MALVASTGAHRSTPADAPSFLRIVAAGRGGTVLAASSSEQDCTATGGKDQQAGSGAGDSPTDPIPNSLTTAPRSAISRRLPQS